MFPFRYSFDPLSPKKKNLFGNIFKDDTNSLDTGGNAGSPYLVNEDEGKNTNLHFRPDNAPGKTFADHYKEIAEADRPMYRAYSDYLTKGAPEYKSPGKWNRLTAALAGAAAGFSNPAAGVQTTQGMLNAPYERAMDRWKIEGQRLGEAARVEESGIEARAKAARELADMERQDRSFQLQAQNIASQIDSRRLSDQEKNLQIQKLQNDLKMQGYREIKDEVSGHSYFVNPFTNNRIDMGKYAESVSEKTTRTRGEEQFKSGLTFSRERAMAGINFGNQKELANINKQTQLELEGVRQQNRLSLADRNVKNQIERDAKRAGLPNSEKVNNILRQNRENAQAIFDANPDAYKDIWTLNKQTGFRELTTTPPRWDSPDENERQAYARYAELYNALHAGTGKELNPTPPRNGNQSGYKIGDPVTLPDGRSAVVTGFDANGKVKVKVQ